MKRYVKETRCHIIKYFRCSDQNQSISFWIQTKGAIAFVVCDAEPVNDETGDVPIPPFAGNIPIHIPPCPRIDHGPNQSPRMVILFHFTLIPWCFAVHGGTCNTGSVRRYTHRMIAASHVSIFAGFPGILLVDLLTHRLPS